MDEPGTRRSVVATTHRPVGDLVPRHPDVDPTERVEPTERVTAADLQREIGELLIETGRLADVLATLDEAETAYGTASARPDPGIERGPTARGHRERERVERERGGPEDPRALDVARVLAHHASRLLGTATPEVAAGAAETAVRLYLANADVINGLPALQGRRTPPPDELATAAAELVEAALAWDAARRDDQRAAAHPARHPGRMVQWQEPPSGSGV